MSKRKNFVIDVSGRLTNQEALDLHDGSLFSISGESYIEEGECYFEVDQIAYFIGKKPFALGHEGVELAQYLLTQEYKKQRSFFEACWENEVCYA